MYDIIICHKVEIVKGAKLSFEIKAAAMRTKL